MTARVTSQEVARLAGVSQSAVSRVFTKGASASSATEKKVRDAAQKLGYRPNILARSVKTGRSRIIGLIVAYLDNHFYPEALEKLSNSLQERGYHVLMFMAGNSQDNVESVMQEILDYQVDGIIIASVSLSSDLAERCEAANVPVCMFNRKHEGSNFGSVTSDNLAGGAKVAQHFVKSGAKHIGYIAGWEGASTQRDREAGFINELARLNFEISHREVGNFDSEQTKSAARAMFGANKRPDAVFVANDHMAFLVMDVIRSEFGLRIPQDVLVIGYDDVPLAAWPTYDLTTVRQPANRMVSRAVDMLLAHIEDGEECVDDIEIDSPLIFRGSAPKVNEEDQG